MSDRKLYDKASEAFVYLDAAMPTVLDTLDHMGASDFGKTFWLAQKALENAHELLNEALAGAGGRT